VAERVLVTGAGGFIGVPLVRELVRRGADVVALDGPDAPGAERLAEQSAEPVDVRDRAALERAVARASPSAIVHLAALHYIPYCLAHPADTLAVNVVGTQHLLDAAAAAGRPRVVFASTGDVYTPSDRPHAESDPLGPINVYGASKAAGEWLGRIRRDLDVHVARLFNTYGPGETNPHVLPAILEQLHAGDVVLLGNVGARRDYVYVHDVVAALAALALHDGDPVTVNLGTGRATSVEELIERLARLTGRPLRVEVDESRLRPVDRPFMAADTARMRELLPELAPLGLDEGLRRTLAAERLL
jgi:UDP-glucose 4-epimerase